MNYDVLLSKIDRACRACQISTPVVLVDWVSLVQVDLKELIVSRAFEVLVAIWC